MNEKKTWKKILSILLIFQIIVAGSLGLLAIFNFSILVGQFGFTYQPDMGILQLIMVYNLFLSAGICLLSVIWIRKGNIAGIQAGIMLGLLMFLVSFIVFIKFDRIDMLLFDSIRALFMVIFGTLAHKEQNKVQTIV